MIIGRRFSICQINIYGSIIEVSSFRTNDKYVNGSEEVDCSTELNGYDEGDILCWKNSLKRDFTINSLFFNPFVYRIYDYVNGVRDLRNNKVCTVIPAHLSFKEDPARILRGLRIAARLGFQFSSETSTAIQDLSSSIINIDKGTFVLQDNRFRWLTRVSLDPSSEGMDATENDSASLGDTAAQTTSMLLYFPCGLIRGALTNLGIPCSVSADM